MSNQNVSEFSTVRLYKNLWESDSPTIKNEWLPEHKWTILGILYHDLQKCIHERALDRIADKTLFVILKFILANYPVVENLDFSSRYSNDREEKEMEDFNILIQFFKLEKYIISGMYDTKCGLFTCELNPNYQEEYFAFDCDYIMNYVMDWTLSCYITNNYDKCINGYEGRRLLDGRFYQDNNWYPYKNDQN